MGGGVVCFLPTVCAREGGTHRSVPSPSQTTSSFLSLPLYSCLCPYSFSLKETKETFFNSQ